MRRSTFLRTTSTLKDTTRADLRLTPPQKQKLGAKLKEVTEFIANEEIIGDQSKKFAHVSKITDNMEVKLQKHLKKDLGDPEVPVFVLREQIKALKNSPEFKNGETYRSFTSRLIAWINGFRFTPKTSNSQT
jgi:hypothetical protein